MVGDAVADPGPVRGPEGARAPSRGHRRAFERARGNLHRARRCPREAVAGPRAATFSQGEAVRQPCDPAGVPARGRPGTSRACRAASRGSAAPSRGARPSARGSRGLARGPPRVVRGARRTRASVHRHPATTIGASSSSFRSL